MNNTLFSVLLCLLEESPLSFTQETPAISLISVEGAHCSPVQLSWSLSSLPCSQLCSYKCRGKMNTFPFPWSLLEVPLRAQPLISKLLCALSHVLLPSAPRDSQSTKMPPNPLLAMEFHKLQSPAPPKNQESTAWNSQGFLPCPSNCLRAVPAQG